MTAPTAPTPRDIAALDVPLTQLAADIAARRTREGALAEQRHQYRDLDADSTCCPQGFVCVNCPPGGAR